MNTDRAQSPARANMPSPPPRPTWARRLRHPMLLWIAGMVTLVLGMNAAMLVISLEQMPRLVAPNYYERGLAYQEVIDARERSRATGLRVQLDRARSVGGRLLISVRDAGGKPVEGLLGRVQAYRPSDPALDQTLMLSPLADAPGSYEAAFQRPLPGLWRLTVSMGRDGAVLEDRPLDRPAPLLLVYETLPYTAE